MKKSFKILEKIFSPLIKFIDKFIVVPLTKFFLMLSKLSNKNGKYIEKWITKTNTLVFISLILALLTFFLVDNKSIILSETSAEVIYNQPVNYIYNYESYVVEGLPEKVDITLIGRKGDLYLSSQLSNHEVTIDMSDLKPGTHRVSLKYKVPLASIDYKLDPSFATVVIYNKESETKTLAIDTLNTEELDEKLFIQGIVPEKTEVTIKGAKHVISKVATVKALLDVKNIPNPAVGTIDVKEVPLLAYDDRGNIIDVEIVPKTIDAKVNITSPSKELPIKVIPKGDVVSGQAISNIISSVNKVVVYGDETILNTLSYIPVEIDVSGLKTNKEFAKKLDFPAGVRYMSEKSVNVKIEIDKESVRTLDEIRINPKNLASGLSIQAASSEDDKVSVSLKGVQSIIDSVDPTTINAYIDLSGFGVGTHEVDVVVEGTDNRITYQSKIKKVKIIIQ